MSADSDRDMQDLLDRAGRAARPRSDAWDRLPERLRRIPQIGPPRSRIFRYAAALTGVAAMILAAVGILQFDVVAHRLKHEYNVECSYENVQVATARWVRCADDKKFTEFRTRLNDNLALDSGGDLVYIAPTRVNLQLTQERWPEVRFAATREHGAR